MTHSARSAERLPYQPTAPPDCATPDRSTASTRFRATVSYDGTDFNGWQTQPGGNTVQDLLEKRLTSILGAQVHIAGSGRTDAGVHAQAQVFHFDLPEAGGHGRVVAAGASPESAAASLQRCLVGLPENNSLPATIRVLSVRPAPADFHSREWNLGKRYVYTVQEGLGCPFSARYRWALGRGKVLDLGRMAEAAALLLGEHDLSHPDPSLLTLRLSLSAALSPTLALTRRARLLIVWGDAARRHALATQAHAPDRGDEGGRA